MSTRHPLDGCVTGKHCYPTAAHAHNALLSTRIADALRTGGVRSVAFGADGHTLATGSYDNIVRLWDIRDSRQPPPAGYSHRPHQHSYLGGFGADGHTLATASYDSTARLWETNVERRRSDL